MNYHNLKINGQDVEVGYDYQPAERSNLEHQGCPEEFIVEALIINGKDCTEALSLFCILEEVTEAFIKDLKEFV